jgi:hypothetical protein
MADKLLALYSLNTLQTIIPKIDGTWQYAQIAGTPLSTMGNGGPLNGVGLSSPVDLDYNAATNALYIRNSRGHLRKVDFTTVPYTTSTLFNEIIQEGWLSTVVNPAGDHFATMGSCSRPYILDFSIAATAITFAKSFIGGPCTAAPYPVPSGTGVNDAAYSFAGAIPIVTTPVYHSNGKLYFSGTANGTSHAFIYESDGTTFTILAGQPGPSGYNASDEGQPALDAQLTNVQQMQQDAQGDLLIWDGTRLRKITVTTEAAQPKIYTLVDYTTISGYSGNGVWRDAYYDEATGYTYYVNGNGDVHKAKLGASDVKYNFTGTTLSGSVRLTKTPVGILVLQPTKARILKIAP